MPSFEFERLGIPCTVQTANKSRLENYKQDVRRAARVRWPGDASPLAIRVQVTITYYYSQDVLDVDNIIKPVLDQLNGLVIVDDRQVHKVTCQKVGLHSGQVLLVGAMSQQSNGLRSRDDFLHILVEWE